MAMAASSLSSFGGQNNVMLMRSDMGSSNSLVAMLTSCNPQLNFQVARSGGGGLEDAIAGVKRPYNCYPTFEATNGGLDGDAEEDVDGENEASQGPVEKKRRLSFDQVRSLERNFEMENKLEPERKMQLAKELGLQPRQVAVWFQNRRARWKTKQLERDYEMLNSGYLKLKAEFETALKEKDVLKAEVQRLSGTRDSQSMDSSQCDSEAVKTGLGSDPAMETTVKDATTTTSSGSHNSSSELVDAESPRTTDSNHMLENYCHEFAVTTDSGPCFVGPGVDDDDDAAIVAAAVKLEDHTGFHVDPSCGYFLPPMVEQSVLPWWDWAA